MGAPPLADQVNSSSKVALILNDWMGISVHAVPVVLEELRQQVLTSGTSEWSSPAGCTPR